MSIFKSIKEWLYPPLIIRDTGHGMRTDNIDEIYKDRKSIFEFTDDRMPKGDLKLPKELPDIHLKNNLTIKPFTEYAGVKYGSNCTLKPTEIEKDISSKMNDKEFPSKRTINRLLGRRDNMSSDNYNEAGDPTKHQGLTDVDESYKDLLYKFDPKAVDTSNIVITRGSKEARDRIAKRDLEFCKDKLPYIQKYLKEAGYIVTEEFKSYGSDRKGPRTMNKDNYNEAGDPTKQEGITDWVEGQKSAESLYVAESAQGYSTDEFINRDKKSDKEASIIYSYDAILKQNRKLKLEILEVKQEVDYYKKYIDFLEENYILILKSPSTLKEAFDEMVGDKK